MPGIVRHGEASWPGIIGVRSCTYTVSHGITPGRAVLTTLPQQDPPDLEGPLVITDQVNTITLANCKVDSIHADGPSPGFTWRLEIVDRRWKWKSPISWLAGQWNIPDPSGLMSRPPPDIQGPIIGSEVKVIPWTIRQPRDLMEDCLKAMGESGYDVSAVPNTLAVNRLPAVTWDYTNPALALQQLTEALGYRIVFRLDTDSVLIAPIGVGANLPDGSIARASPSIDIPPRPDRLRLIGAPVRYQQPIVLEAVGLDWDGTVRPINDLTYAPLAQQIAHKVTITPGPVFAGDTFNVTIVLPNQKIVQKSYVAGAATVADVCNGLTASLNFGPALAGAGITATTDGSTITITGNPDGSQFTIATWANHESQVIWKLIQAGQDKLSPWAFSAPPAFPNVRATKRLTYHQARDLAQQSVFRYYRIVNVDPATRQGSLSIPEYGFLTRIQQVLLMDSKLDPTFPEPGDPTQVDLRGDPLIQDYYDGYSRERRAQVYGSYYPEAAGVRILDVRKQGLQNTAVDQPVWCSFSVDPERQLIKFDRHVYFKETYGVSEPDLVLETSFMLRDGTSNNVIRTTAFLDMPPPHFGTPEAIFKHEDVQLLTVQRCDMVNLQPLWIDDNKVEMQLRALYYLEAEASKYELKNALTLVYNGIELIPLDGAICQVTWEVGESGARTTASRNGEHATYIPPYPARLRLEYLNAPDRLQQLVLQARPGKPRDFGGIPQ